MAEKKLTKIVNIAFDALSDLWLRVGIKLTKGMLSPEMVFRFGLVWANMALAKAESAGITDNRKVVLARDARKIEPELVGKF